jgi:hypothetical protein
MFIVLWTQSISMIEKFEKKHNSYFEKITTNLKIVFREYSIWCFLFNDGWKKKGSQIIKVNWKLRKNIDLCGISICSSLSNEIVYIFRAIKYNFIKQPEGNITTSLSGISIESFTITSSQNVFSPIHEK